MVPIVLLLVISATAGVSAAECPLGWILNQGWCYSFHEEYLNWFDAASVCQLYGNSRLVQVDTSEKQAWLAEQSRRYVFYNIWLGGSSRLHMGVWEWIPGYKQVGKYTNWGTGLPDYPTIEKCLEMRSDRNYQWNDLNCLAVNRFICEKKNE